MGGLGFDVSNLRPAGSRVKNSAITSSGMSSFMQRYSNTVGETGQNGRRAALMLSCSIDSLGIEEFINAKTNLSKITGANISVKLGNEFMHAVEHKEMYKQHNSAHTEIDASKVFDNIVNNAWQYAEPGVLFWDTILKYSNGKAYGEDYTEVSTNPCSELPLPAFASCILLHMNLSTYVKHAWTIDAYFDFKAFTADVQKAARIADDFIDLEIEAVDSIINKINSDPESEEIKHVELYMWQQVKRKLVNTRRYGMGFMGLGDVFAKLGITYGTQKSIELGEAIQKCICKTCYTTSIQLAKERGCFPIFDIEKDKQSEFIQRVLQILPTATVEMYEKYGRRNIACNTVAPVGSTALLAQTTSGIEPVFMPLYKRRRKLNANDDESIATFVDTTTGEKFVDYIVVHYPLLEWIANCVDIESESTFGIKQARYQTIELTPDIVENIITWLTSLSNESIQALLKASPYHNSTTQDVDWIGKVELQGAIQKYVDAAISVTINLPATATKELVHDIYMTAWKSGCKGCTIYRDGSRSGVLVDINDNRGNAKSKPNTLPNGKRSKRKPILPANIYTVKVKGEYWAIFIGIDSNVPYEVFAFKVTEQEFEQLQTLEHTTITKECKKHYALGNNCSFLKHYNDIVKRFDFDEQQTITRLYSTMLRNGIELQEIVDQTEKSTAVLSSFCKAIGRALKTFMAEGSKLYEKCPECGGDLVKYDGCIRCKNCGYSKCG